MFYPLFFIFSRFGTLPVPIPVQISRNQIQTIWPGFDSDPVRNRQIVDPIWFGFRASSLPIWTDLWSPLTPSTLTSKQVLVLSGQIVKKGVILMTLKLDFRDSICTRGTLSEENHEMGLFSKGNCPILRVHRQKNN